MPVIGHGKIYHMKKGKKLKASKEPTIDGLRVFVKEVLLNHESRIARLEKIFGIKSVPGKHLTGLE